MVIEYIGAARTDVDSIAIQGWLDHIDLHSGDGDGSGIGMCLPADNYSFKLGVP